MPIILASGDSALPDFRESIVLDEEQGNPLHVIRLVGRLA